MTQSRGNLLYVGTYTSRGAEGIYTYRYDPTAGTLAPLGVTTGILNPTFLTDPLRHLESDQVIMQFNDKYSPMALSGDQGFLYVIMPMRG